MKKENKEQLDEGKQSLESMLETLRPFLPKLDLSMPEPANKWKVTGTTRVIGSAVQSGGELPPF